MKKVPAFEVREFDCIVQPHNVKATGNVTHVVREGWARQSEHYVVDVCVNGRSFKFSIVPSGIAHWCILLLSVLDSQMRIAGVNTFFYANAKIEYLFEEALMNLVIYNESAEDDE